MYDGFLGPGRLGGTAGSSPGHPTGVDMTDAETFADASSLANRTLQKFLQYCQEVVSKQADPDDNIMHKVILYGQDFKGIGLKESEGVDWFCVDEASSCQSVHCPWGETDQRQLYYNLFDFQRQQKLVGGDLICGIGIARKVIIDEHDRKRQVWHPVILIRLEIVESEGHVRILPSRMHVPELWSMSPFCSNEYNKHKIRDLEDRFQIHLQELKNRQQRISPFDYETYEGFLGEFRRCWRGDLVSTDDSPTRPASYEHDVLQAYWQALERRELQLINEWVLFTQTKRHSAQKEDIQSFIRQLDCVKAPPWASFLGLKLSDPNVQHRCEGAGGAGATHEWLFPLKSNQQQQDIAEMLGRWHTVVVQGPPGTGSTHTLANVVSDAVAKGQRVLVLSARNSALQVLMDLLPGCLSNVAMFFVDGQTQNQPWVIRAVEQMLRIVSLERRRPVAVAQAAADMERLHNFIQDMRTKKGEIEAELQLRAELMLLPFARPLGAWLRGPLAEACRLREAVRGMVGEGPLMRKHLLSLILGICCPREAGEEEPEWLEDLPTDTRAELTAKLTNEIAPLLSAVFERDLYREFEKMDSALRKATEELIGLHIEGHILESSRKPSFSVLAKQFLELLRAGQGSGRGRQARHWKLAREILAQEQTLIKAFPLWIMTTGMVSELLPSSFGLFDIVAIDKASESEVFEVPAMLRGDRVLIIGDNQQLGPCDNNINERRRLQELARLREDITPHLAMQYAFEPGQSVFDIFSGLHVSTPASIMLREHFRCTRDIIYFCNHAFYKGDLEPLRVSRRGERLLPSIRVNAQAEPEPGRAEVAEEAKGGERERLELLAAALAGMNTEQLKNECRVMLPPPPPPPVFFSVH